MDYVYDLTIPANTAQMAPVELELPAIEGVIHQFEVGFPKGCAGLVHAMVRRGVHQVWPSNPDSDYNWDNHVYETREHLRMLRRSAPLVLQGWNEDDTFPHTVTFRFGILPASILEAAPESVSWLKKLVKLWGGSQEL